MNLNIDALAFIMALRADTTGTLRERVERALRLSPGHRPLTEDEIPGEVERTLRTIAPDGELIQNWDKRAGGL